MPADLLIGQLGVVDGFTDTAALTYPDTSKQWLFSPL